MYLITPFVIAIQYPMLNPHPILKSNSPKQHAHGVHQATSSILFLFPDSSTLIPSRPSISLISLLSVGDLHNYCHCLFQ
jgi:hypothetical protein